MQNTLHDHIILLEQKIQILKDQLTRGDHASIGAEPILAEIQTAELALLYYRKAFELENQASLMQLANQSTNEAKTSPKNASSSRSTDDPTQRDRESYEVQLLNRLIEATDRLLFGDLDAALG